ncbi:MAG: biotin/lipoyl-containing protein [Planctomycetota bacterium]
MKYFVTVNGAPHEVELSERLGELLVRYDGAPLDVRFEEVDRLGQVALYVGDASYAVSIEGNASSAVVTVAGALYTIEIEDERERAAHSAARASGGHGGVVKSVMPGVVIELLAREGEVVAKGQPLLILEAMKMQNEIAAPMAGIVKGFHVAEGEAVGNGAKLVTLAAPAE